MLHSNCVPHLVTCPAAASHSESEFQTSTTNRLQSHPNLASQQAYGIFCLIVAISSTTGLAKSSVTKATFPKLFSVLDLWMNVVMAFSTFSFGRKTLQAKDQKELRGFGHCILTSLLPQMSTDWPMLFELAKFDELARIAKTDNFELAYFVILLLFATYQLFVAICALWSARRLKPPQNVFVVSNC